MAKAGFALFISIFMTAVISTSAQAGLWDQTFSSMKSASTGASECSNQNLDHQPISTDELCNSPATSICEKFGPSSWDQPREAIRKQIGGTRGRDDAFSSQYEKIKAIDDPASLNGMPSDDISNLYLNERKQISLIASVESEILKHFPQVTPETLSALYAKIQKSLLAEVESSQFFSQAAQVKQKLSSVTFETASSIDHQSAAGTDLQRSQQIVNAARFIQTCGPDGLAVNAFYDPKSNTVKICPGYLLKNLNDNQGNLEPLSWVLGHEMGHSIDPSSKVNSAAYSDFLGCVDSKYIKPNAEKFVSLSRAIEQLYTQSLPNLKIELQKLQQESPPNPAGILRIQRGINALSQQLKLYENAATQEGIAADRIIDHQADELVADLHGTAALADQLSKANPADRNLLAAQAFRANCPGTDPATQHIRDLIGGTVDVEHPPLKFRMEMTFRSPAVRKALGCKPVIPSRPWCGLKAN